MTEQKLNIKHLGTLATLRVLLELKKSQLSALTDLGESSDVSLFKLVGKKFYLLSEIGLLEKLFQQDQKKMVKTPKAQLYTKKAIGRGLVSTDKQEWTEKRRAVKTLFNDDHLRHLFTPLPEKMESQLAKAPSKTDAFELLNRLSIQSMAAILFGEMAPRDEQSLVDLLDGLSLVTFKKILYPLPFLTDPFNNQLHGARKELLSIIERATQAARKKQTPCLVNSHFLHQKPYEDISNVFIAGFETSASALFWLLYELKRHEHWSEQIKKELTISHDELSYEFIKSKVPKTRACIKEALRLYPPIWVMNRTPTEAFEIDGIQFDEKSDIIISPYLFHRLNKYWDQPDRFRPNRFLQGKVHPYFFPFGKGPRACIGEHLAYMQIIVLLRALYARGFDLEDQWVGIKAQFTLKPNDQLTISLNDSI